MKMCFSQNSGCFGENICFSGKKETCCALLTVEDKCSIAPQFFRILADTTATCARWRAVVYMPRVSSELRRLPFWPICKERCERHASTVGETVPVVGGGTRLRLRARCSGSNTGRRSPWGPATRKVRPGVESPPQHISMECTTF